MHFVRTDPSGTVWIVQITNNASYHQYQRNRFRTLHVASFKKKKKKDNLYDKRERGITGRDKSFPIFVKSTAVVTTEH